MEGTLKIPSSNPSAVGRDTFHQIRLIKAISKYNLPKYFFFPVLEKCANTFKFWGLHEKANPVSPESSTH